MLPPGKSDKAVSDCERKPQGLRHLRWLVSCQNFAARDHSHYYFTCLGIFA
jgi:hypothetical protein